MSIQEVAPDIVRLESVLGPRPFAQYLVHDERSLLVDTGIVSTPDAVILPAMQSLGLNPAALDYIVITHADVDHFGGNGRLRTVAPRVTICAHSADAPFIIQRDRIMRERYGWYAEHGAALDYDAATKEWLREAVGPDTPVDLELTGGERFRLGPRLALTVLHLPGHSPGHLGLWEPRSRSAIVTDAVLGNGLFDHAGNLIQPPPYIDIPTYEATIHLLRQLAPARLLTAHYPIIEGDGVECFLTESEAFVARARAAVTDALTNAGESDLIGLLAPLNDVLGPFATMSNELAGPVRAHLRELVAIGRAEEVAGRRPPVWRMVR